jgi:hypothetical protein
MTGPVRCPGCQEPNTLVCLDDVTCWSRVQLDQCGRLARGRVVHRPKPIDQIGARLDRDTDLLCTSRDCSWMGSVQHLLDATATP